MALRLLDRSRLFLVRGGRIIFAVAVMRRETGGWKWPALQFGYMLALAFVGAWRVTWLV